MARPAPLLLLVSAAAAAYTAPAEGRRPLCRALDAVAREARASRKPQEFAIVSLREPNTFACRHAKGARGAAFCTAASKGTSWEFIHILPWNVRDCLLAHGLQPVLERTDQFTGIGRKRIVRLQARWRSGAQIDLRWKPNEEPSDDPRFEGYYGEYQLVVSPD